MNFTKQEQKLLDVLNNKGHTALPDMTTYTAYNEYIRMFCTGCELDKLVRYGNVCNRGCPCECTKAEVKRKKEEKKRNKPPRKTKPLCDRWIDNNYNSRIENSCPNLIPIPQTFISKDLPMKMFCNLCEEIIDKRAGDAVSGSNCINCFGVGFNKKIDGTLYVLKIMDSIGNVIAYKIGITNKTAEERCRTINKSTTLHCEVIYSYSAIGSKVQKIESIIKKSIESAYINKELMNDGSTETFNPTHIFHVIHLIFEHAK